MQVRSSFWIGVIGFTSNAIFESLQEQFPDWAHGWERKSAEEFELETLGAPAFRLDRGAE
mgnify:CR=1 FL=1